MNLKQTGLNSKAVMDLVKKLLDDDTLHITMQPYNPLSIPFIKNCLVIITRIHPQKCYYIFILDFYNLFSNIY